MKPFSQACENNQAPILAAITPYLSECRELLEIGSGTGQHAVHFGAALSHLRWRTSDRRENHDGIRAWLEEAALSNVIAPVELDVDVPAHWPRKRLDAVYSANTAHIMGWGSVCNMFAGVGELLPTGGVFLLYGPFSRGGRHVSDSNRRFDASLRAQDPAMGVRDLDDLQIVAATAGLSLEQTLALPANNHLTAWLRVSA